MLVMRCTVAGLLPTRVLALAGVVGARMPPLPPSRPQLQPQPQLPSWVLRISSVPNLSLSRADRWTVS